MERIFLSSCSQYIHGERKPLEYVFSPKRKTFFEFINWFFDAFDRRPTHAETHD